MGTGLTPLSSRRSAKMSSHHRTQKMHPKSIDAMADPVREFILAPDPGAFEPTALQVFHFQFAQNLPYQKYCQSVGKSPENVTSWLEIPAIPTNAFKFNKFPLVSGGESRTTFLTSGTTTELRGEHHFPDTSLYELSISRTWQNAGLPGLPALFFAPSPTEAPQSSLSHMFGHLGNNNPDTFLLRENRFHLAPLFRQIDSDQPLMLMGTALAFLHLLETHSSLPLPSGSHVLETGGYKGSHRELSKPDFYQQLSSFFNLPQSSLHNEYGMTELSTQAYATGPEGSHRFPPWCRYRVMDPESGLPAPEGQIGYLQLFDLANLYSVAAIRTQDFAIQQADGSFSLIGRDPGALPRGCSRTIDHAFSS